MSHSFDIDRAVRTWRAFLKNQGSFTLEDLDELESHLWEEIEQRRRPGISDELVFHAAVREVGDFAELESTFRGVQLEKMWRPDSRTDSLRAGLDLTVNHLLLAWRSLVRNPGLNLINITGLAVGIAVCVLIFLFIEHERSYDTFHEKAERTYRIQAHDESLGTSALLAPTLVAEFPAVENAVRVSQRYFEVKVIRGDESFFDDGFLFVDSTFFEMFDFRMLSGDPATALSAPFDLVLTQSVAEQYFGSDDPVGRILRIEGSWDAHDYTVTGVVEDPPSNTHLDFRFLAPFDTRHAVEPSPENIDHWYHVGDHTYVTLTPSASPDSLHARMPGLYDRVHERPLPEGVEIAPIWKPQPITAIHHGPVYQRQIKPVSDPQYLYVFGAVGLIVLLIGSFNYVNLVTARSVRRAREIGIRKVAGAARSQLVRQLITETALTAGIAVLAGIALVRLGVPLLDQIVGSELDVVVFGSPDFWGFVTGVWATVTLLAGIYPAFVISRVKPARVVKGLVTSDRSNARLRHTLVVAQFTASAILIVGTLFVRGQLSYMQTTNLGLHTEQVLVVETGGLLGAERDDVFKEEVERHPDVVGVSATSIAFPLSNDNANRLIFPERPTRDHRPPGASMISVDTGFIETMGLSVIEGRAFQEGDAERGKSITPVILNQEAVRALGWGDPIGRAFECCFRPTPTVVGVVEDFHFQSLKEPIKPIALNPSWFSRTILVRTTAAGAPNVVDRLEELWTEFGEGTPLNWYFLDDNFEAAYDAEQRLARSFGFFAGLAVFIACLGLLGLAAFMVQRRTHEIGVRKVLGATARSIVGLLTRDFLKWVVIALVIGVPIAYWLGLRWLESFPYQAPVGAGWIAAAVAGILLIAAATVASQSVGAAMRNPAETLRHE